MAVAEREFQIDGVRYSADRFGVIHQVSGSVTQVYDLEYVRKRYDAIPREVEAMSWLRAGFVLAAIGRSPRSVLDIGYGNGAFLRIMQRWGGRCFGHDITGYPLPDGCIPLEWGHCFPPIMDGAFDLVTFFDSLEHMPNLSFLERLKMRYVAITAPAYRPGASLKWFTEWKHRRPGEHIHHFSPQSLDVMMRHFGYRRIATGNPEDAIRQSSNCIPNTFTSVFSK